MKKTIFVKLLGILVVTAMLMIALPMLDVQAEGNTIIPVYILSASWNAEGGGGVYSGYAGPSDYNLVSPGSTGLYLGREAGIIKAGLTPDPDGHYWDEGLFGFKTDISIGDLATGPLQFDVVNQAGINPVWMTIELDTGALNERSDNTTFQFVPTSNPAGWHTVDGAAGYWQKWNNNDGNTSGNPLIYLSDIAADYPSIKVVRIYLRLGMGDSYNNNGTGTIGWVDSVTIKETVYDFQVRDWYVASNGSDNNLGNDTSPFATIQHAVDAASEGDTIHVGAGTYYGAVLINKPLTLVSTDGPAQTTIHGGELAESALYVVSIRASNVTFSGFTVTSPNFNSPWGGDPAGIMIGYYGDNDLSNIRVTNNKVTQIGSTARIVEEDGWPSTGICVNAVVNGLEIDHNTVYDIHQTVNDPDVTWGPTGIGYYGYGLTPLSQNVSIHDNTVYNISASKTGGAQPISNGIVAGWGSGNASITNNIVYDIDGRAISAGSSNYGTLQIAGNTVENSQVGIYMRNANLGSIRSNKIALSNTIAVQNANEASTLDASSNWWGNQAGVGANRVIGLVDFTPWCTDENCTATTPDANGNVYISGSISVPGGIFINEPNLILHLAANTVIQNDSPCFVINASHTQILAEPGAKCVPTNGSNGIDIAEGLTDIRIAGLEIDGTGQTKGDGIHFNGAITDFQIVNNYIHNLGGSAIEFVSVPSGNVKDIKGNLFKDNNDTAIVVPAMEPDLNAEYNSWGTNADPNLTNVDADPWTYVSLTTTSTGAPMKDQSKTNDWIVYEVKADLKNVTGVSFELTYPVDLMTITYITAGTDFMPVPNKTSVIDWSTPGVIKFDGYSTTPVSVNKTLYSVTFLTKTTVGVGTLDLVETNDKFAMSPGYGPSTNVYASSLIDGSIRIFSNMPAISSTDIQGYYFVDEERQFNVTLDNPSDGGIFNQVKFHFRFEANEGDITSLKYDAGGGNFVELPFTCSSASGYCEGDFGPTTGFPISAPYHVTTAFKVTFHTAKDYPINISLYALDSLPPNLTLAIYNNTAIVYAAKPTISSPDIQGYYLSGEQRQFSVVLTNPTGGGNFAHVYVDFQIFNAKTDQIQSIEYSVDNGASWVGLGVGPGTSYGDSDNGSDIVGYFGKITGGGFPLNGGSELTTLFRVNFKTREQEAIDYPTSYAVSMRLMDADTSRLLSDYTATANVYDKPSISSTDIIGAYLAGIAQDFHVKVVNPATGGNFSDSIYYVFTITGAQSEDIKSLNCNGIPVSLSVSGTDLVGRVGYGTAGFPMPPDQAWENTCNVQFKKPGSYPFTVDMVDNPSGVPANDRLLASLTETATVTGNFAITGTFSMQGRVSRGGIPITFSWLGTGWTYNPFASTIDVLTNNLNLTVIYGGGYRITTNQPRYLNVTEDLNKLINVTVDKVLTALELKGGNAKWSDNEINIQDATVVGAKYEVGNINDDADVNFDNQVNIQDLALVGGNFDLTSALAYDIWVP